MMDVSFVPHPLPPLDPAFDRVAEVLDPVLTALGFAAGQAGGSEGRGQVILCRGDMQPGDRCVPCNLPPVCGSDVGGGAVSGLTDRIRTQAGSAKVGVLFEDERYTWGELYSKAAQRAAFLEGRRWSEPRHLGVLLENVPE